MKTQPEPKSKPSREEFVRLIGTNPSWQTDPILKGMLRDNDPIDLATYLELGYGVKTLDELGPEDAANVPAFLKT